MEIKKGIPVCPGIAIAEAFRLEHDEEPTTERYFAPEQVRGELARFESAVETTRAELHAARERVPEDIRGIFDFHLAILGDKKHLLGPVRDAISKRTITPEYATSQTLRKVQKEFAGLADSYFAQRSADVKDVERRLLRVLRRARATSLRDLDRPVVVLAHDLTPSQTAGFEQTRVAALVTDLGGATSHTAIVARSLGIPAVVGVKNITREAVGGDQVIVDGRRGWVILEPDAETLEKYRAELGRQHAFERTLVDAMREVEAVTKDGVHVVLLANIEFTSEIPGALQAGAEGIGLFRTEFLYHKAGRIPTEAEHLAEYRRAYQALGDRPLIIRTFDFGADKFRDVVGGEPEPNPFLGCRSIRLCLENLAMFKSQLRAAVLAGQGRVVRLMFPMISNVEEFATARRVLDVVTQQLRQEEKPLPERLELGLMVEVPGVALCAERFAPHVQFLSIGTNDLTQYTLAVDRGNERVAHLFQPAHPAVWALIDHVVKVGRKFQVEVSVCGEVAGDPLHTIPLLGMGLRTMSMPPPLIPVVKQIIRHTTIKEAQRVRREALKQPNDTALVEFLRQSVRKAVPDLPI